MENKEDSFKKELNRLKGSLKRRIKTLRKSLKKAEARLHECESWPSVRHDAELIQSHLYLIKKGDEKVIASDWDKEGALITIALDLKLKPHEEVAKRFKRAQKLEKGLPFASAEVTRTKVALEHYSALLIAMEEVLTEEALKELKSRYPLPQPQEKITKETKEPSKPYLEYRSKSGICIWVGKSAAMNDQLTFRHASGNDLWLHIADHPGSHVVIHPTSGQVIDEETIDQALQLALHYSKARKYKVGEVVMTKVKHVRRFGKQKGKVQIANEKRVFVTLHPL